MDNTKSRPSIINASDSIKDVKPANHIVSKEPLIETALKTDGEYALENKPEHVPAKGMEAVRAADIIDMEDSQSDEEPIDLNNEGMVRLRRPRVVIAEDTKGLLSDKNLIDEISEIYRLTGSKIRISKMAGGRGKGGKGAKTEIEGGDLKKIDNQDLLQSELEHLHQLRLKAKGSYRKRMDKDYGNIKSRLTALKKNAKSVEEAPKSVEVPKPVEEAPLVEAPKSSSKKNKRKVVVAE